MLNDSLNLKVLQFVWFCLCFSLADYLQIHLPSNKQMSKTNLRRQRLLTVATPGCCVYGPKHLLPGPYEKLQSVCWQAEDCRRYLWTSTQVCLALWSPLWAWCLPNHPLGANSRQFASCWRRCLSFIDTLRRDTSFASAEELRSCMLDQHIWTKNTGKAHTTLHGTRLDEEDVHVGAASEKVNAQTVN